MHLHGKPCADLTLHSLPKVAGCYLTAPDLFEPWSETLDPSREYRRLAACPASRWLVTTKYPRRMCAWWEGLVRNERYMRWVDRIQQARNLGTCIEVQNQEDIDAILKLVELELPTTWNAVVVCPRGPLNLAYLQGWANLFILGKPSEYRPGPFPTEIIEQARYLRVPTEIHWGGWVPLDRLPEPERLSDTSATIALTPGGKASPYRIMDGAANIGSWPPENVIDWETMHASQLE